MKRYLTLIFILLCACAQAKEFKFRWDPNPETDIEGYRLHFGDESGVYTRTVDCGNTTTYTIEVDLDAGEAYSVVTAYNTAGLESLPSNELHLTGDAPGAPGGFHVTLPDPETAQVEIHAPGEHIVLEGSEDLREWDELARGYGYLLATFARRERYFFRTTEVTEI